jgi:hypothetical protein
MGSQALAAIIAFAAGVVVTTLGGWFSHWLERRKHLAQLASVAFVDMTNSFCINQQSEAALASRGSQITHEEMQYWHRRIYETRADYFSAKARLAAFGSSVLNVYYAEIERRGGITGNDPVVRDLTTKMILSFRAHLGFKKNEVSERDLAAVLFGPLDSERETPSPDGLRGWPVRTFSQEFPSASVSRPT